MYAVNHTSRYNIIDVNGIKYGVHLIPKYRHTLRAPATEVPIGCFGPEVCEHFEEFSLNLWIDIYQYNNMY